MTEQTTAVDERAQYLIDLPPPTVAEITHIGHLFIYIQTDVLARYKTARGFDVVFPVAWDDGNWYTEEWYSSVDPQASQLRRDEFRARCAEAASARFERTRNHWRQLGITAGEGGHKYATSDTVFQRCVQSAFLGDLRRNRARRFTNEDGSPGWALDLSSYDDATVIKNAGDKWCPPELEHRFEQVVSTRELVVPYSARQRCGTPIPLWYRLDENCVADCDSPIVPEQIQLPIDPTVDVPNGFAPEQRDQPGGFIADTGMVNDAMAAACTYLRVIELGNGSSGGQVDLRTLGHYIIDGWLLDTIMRSVLQGGPSPFRTVMLSGKAIRRLDADGKEPDPEQILASYSPDAIRYWAVRAPLAFDTDWEPSVVEAGEVRARQVREIRATLASVSDRDGVARRLTELLESMTVALDNCDHSAATVAVESFLDWLEEHKDTEATTNHRESEDGGWVDDAAGTFQRMVAPLFPFAAEAGWRELRDDSVFDQGWPVSAN